MHIPKNSLDRPPPPNTGGVTLLAGCWVFTGACGLFQSLLVTHEIIPCLASFAPLLGGWAALERKRWGRLALLGMSWTILGAGILGFSLLIMVENHYGQHMPRKYAALAAVLLRFYAGNRPDVIRLPLAAVSGVWLRRARVIAEFDYSKRRRLTVMQHCIAMALVLISLVPSMRGLAPSMRSEHVARSRAFPEPDREARR